MAGRFPYTAKRRVVTIGTLETMVERDPEQEDLEAALPDDPVVMAVAGIISPETIEAGEPIRAADVTGHVVVALDRSR